MLSEELKCKNVNVANVFLRKLKDDLYVHSYKDHTEYFAKFEYKIYDNKEHRYGGVITVLYSTLDNKLKVSIFRFSDEQIVVKEFYKINEILSLIEKIYDETIDRNTGELKNEK